MVLLDALVHNRLEEITSGAKQLQIEDKKLIVAHFDHGIREDSASDEAFVGGVAKQYGLQYESERVDLGPDASEEIARKARYSFLRRYCKKYQATLITAHHQDDLLETMLINLIRGTGWRGLASLDSDAQILRPLLNTPKADLLEYASKYNVEWREDSTNTDTAYLRNYIRLELLPRMLHKDPAASQKLINIYNKAEALKKEIATELQKIIPVQHSADSYSLPRYQLIMWPSLVACEVLYHMLTQLDPDWHPSRLQIERSLHFIKGGLPYKDLEVSGSLKLHLTKREVRFKRV